MKRKFWLKCVIILLLVVVTAGSLGLFWTLSQNQKDVVTLPAPELEEYAMEAASSDASIVVYGKVIEKGAMVASPVKNVATGEEAGYDYFTPVTVEIIDMVKKNGMYGLDLAGEEITYWEYGGEQDETVYQYEDVDLVQTGKEYVFFLGSDNKCLSPQSVVPVVKGNVPFEGYLVPDCFYSQETESVKGVPVQLYNEMIRGISLRAEPTVDGIYNLHTLAEYFDCEIFYGEIVEIEESSNEAGEAQYEWKVRIEESFKGDYAVGEGVVLQDKGDFCGFGDVKKGDKYFFFWMAEEKMLVPLIYQTDGLVYCEFHEEDVKYGQKALLYTAEDFLEVLRKTYKGQE